MARHAPGIPLPPLESMTPEEGRYVRGLVEEDLKGELELRITLAKVAGGARLVKG